MLQWHPSNSLAKVNVFNLDLNVAMESKSFNGTGNLFRKRGAITRMLSLKNITQVLFQAPSVEKDLQRFSNPCPDEHFQDPKDQQTSEP